MTSPDVSLYRFYDRRGELLYVGISKRPFDRFEQHRLCKSWWSRVAHVDIAHYVSWVCAVAAERRAIEDERPAFNVQHAAKREVGA